MLPQHMPSPELPGPPGPPPRGSQDGPRCPTTAPGSPRDPPPGPHPRTTPVTPPRPPEPPRPPKDFPRPPKDSRREPQDRFKMFCDVLQRSVGLRLARGRGRAKRGPRPQACLGRCIELESVSATFFPKAGGGGRASMGACLAQCFPRMGYHLLTMS